MLYVNSELLLFQVHLIESLGPSTHSSMVRIGPISWWLKINMGRFFLSLARISHTQSTAEVDLAASTALPSVGLLNVPYSTFAGADPERVPSRVAQRTQAGTFGSS